jgi:hypothetical protein
MTTQQKLKEAVARYEEALRLIATGPRPDGTYNYDRKACQQIAERALNHKPQSVVRDTGYCCPGCGNPTQERAPTGEEHGDD